MNQNNYGRGFSGIKDLVSDISIIKDAVLEQEAYQDYSSHESALRSNKDVNGMSQWQLLLGKFNLNNIIKCVIWLALISLIIGPLLGEFVDNAPSKQESGKPDAVKPLDSKAAGENNSKNNNNHIRNTKPGRIGNYESSLPKELSLPRSGQEWVYTKSKRIAPFAIKTSSGGNYLVRIVDAYSGKLIMQVFVRGGDTVNTKVPLGEYYVKYAMGYQWYGTDILFGSETSYHKANEMFNFEVTGNYVNGYTVTLYKVVGGNLTTMAIRREEF